LARSRSGKSDRGVPLFKTILITKDAQKGRTITAELAGRNIVCDYLAPHETVDEEIADKAPDLVILALENPLAASPIIEAIRELRRERPIPILALIAKDALDKGTDTLFAVDDFVIEPSGLEEIALRVKKLLKETYAVDGKDVIRNNDLVIDLARREVTLNGKTLSLTFTEYELLVFLAANSGRAFTREALLNKIWGYDYYGGDRTVDVHIRRLRAKIEWGQHSFIETVRGVGYRFKKSSD
jgi:two-component system, OmpR family, alkaline phosphatase synthesis response regulator PhoP